MKQDKSNSPGAVVLPPLLWLVTLGIGLALHLVFPKRFLPRGRLQLIIGLPLIGIAVSLMAWADRTMKQAGTNVNPTEPTTALVDEGPYQFSRNPMYLAGTMILTGIAIAVNTLWIILLLPIQTAILILQIKREERYLERKFGQEYQGYKARVRRWL